MPMLKMYVYTIELDPSAATLSRLKEKKPKLASRRQATGGQLPAWLKSCSSASAGVLPVKSKHSPANPRDLSIYTRA